MTTTTQDAAPATSLGSITPEQEMAEASAASKEGIDGAAKSEQGEAQADTVPRSRYDACNADWLAARDELKRVREIAKNEIERLERELRAAQDALADAESAMNEAERANGDAPHRAVLLAARVKVLADALAKAEAALVAEREKKRPFADYLAQQVIDGQIKEIDRLTKLVQVERRAREEWEIKAKERAAHALTLAYERQDQEQRAEAAERRLAEVERETIERCLNEIPTNWCDPLLTGPTAVIKDQDCRQIEALLRGIQDRLRALLPQKTAIDAAMQSEGKNG